MAHHACEYRELLERTAAVTYLADFEGFVVRYVSPQIEALLGFPVADWLASNDFWLGRVHPDDRDRVEREMAAAMGERRGLDREYRLLHRDGTPVWVWERTSLVSGHDGEPVAVQGVLMEVGTLKAAEAREAGILEAALDAIVTMDGDGLVLEFNPAAERIFGYRREHVLGRDMAELIIPSRLREAHRRGLAAAVAGGCGALIGRRITLPAQRADGTEFPAELTITRLRTGDRSLFTGLLRDVTDRVSAEQELRDERDRAQRYLDIAGTMLIACDAEARVRLINRKGCAVLGYSEADLVGRNFIDVALPEAERAEVAAAFQAMMAGDDEILDTHENHVVTRDGERRLIAWRNSAIRDASGTATGSLSSGEDITERRAAEERIAHLAYHDALTGLPNRTQLEERLALRLGEAERTGDAVALLHLDLDDFKLVNDSFGHAVGDEILCAVGRRIERCLRPDDLLARQGGDEFMLLAGELRGQPLPAALAVAHSLVAALREPFDIAGVEFQIDATVGISLYPFDAGTPDALLRHADAAMYAGKGSVPVKVYTAGSADPRSRLTMTRRLSHAMEHGELELHYQPVVTLADGKPVGAEALLRWRDPERGLVAPGDFLPIAEETALIEPIGDWVVEELCRQAREWRDAGYDPRLAFNVSLRQLRPGRFAAMLDRSLTAHGVDPSRITAEITESATMHEPERVERTLQELHELGVRVAIDDFGSGYSSLGRLQQMPVDVLKIDRSFLRDLPGSESAGAVVAMIVQLAAALGLETIAEGVETEAQRALLLARGCRLSQGYLFGRPVPAAEITQRFAALRRTGAPGPVR